MDTKKQVIYEAPSAQVFEVAREGAICQTEVAMVQRLRTNGN